MNYSEFLSDCDLLIKAGQIKAVAEKIRSLSLTQVPRNFRQAFAKVCRRCGLIETGLRLLQPLIRNKMPLDQPATAAEICEYAALLSRNGSVSEALSLLATVNPIQAPEAFLYRGFCHVLNWNYQEAAVEFENFITSHGDPYSKLIARVNLVASYGFFGEFQKAESLLNETLVLAQQAQSLRLVGNCYELRGQIAFLQGDFQRSRSELDRSTEILGSIGSYDQLLIQKWRSTISALETKSLEPLLKFRSEALGQKHWESVRDVDYYQLKIEFDQKTLNHLLFGTPSQFYRQRVLTEFSSDASSTYCLGSPGPLKLDLRTGALSSGENSIAGTKVHQMILALLGDFYAPRNLGTLFAELYPDEFFDIDSSPVKVRQVLKRTRKWLADQQIPALIEESNGSYKLHIVGDFEIEMEFQKEVIDINTAQWKKLVEVFPSGRPFTADEACHALQISRTGFHRFLKWTFEKNLLIKSGVNKSTIYQIRPRLSKHPA